MASRAPVHPIVVYRIEKHPLDVGASGRGFQWLGCGEGLRRDLEGLIGPHDPGQVSVLVDPHPAGPAWRELIESLLQERVRMVVTHLAPLTSGQRQQLIAVCAQSGTRLITPSDAGRRRQAEAAPRSL